MPSPSRSARFERRPVSRRRWWIGLAVLVLLLAMMGSYALLTRPERVRRFAEDYLANMTGGVVHIGAAHFDPFEGLRLTDVSVATQPDPAFDPEHNAYEDRILFTSRHLQLKLQPFSVITGDLVVPEIAAVEPTLRLLKDPATGVRNWQHLLRKRRVRKERTRHPAEKLPTIRLRNAGVDLAWVHPSEDHIPTRLRLDITATSGAADPTAYDVQWRTRSEPIEDGRFELDLGRLVLQTAEGGLPTIPMESVRWAAPLELERWLDLLDLRGQVHTDSLAYVRGQGGRAEITVQSASLAIPLDDEERESPRDERYLNFSDVTGRLTFEPDAVTVLLTGQWREGTCTLDGRITADPGAIRSLDDIGFTLQLEARNILLPAQPDDRTPAEERFVKRWSKVSVICQHYDPVGRVDLLLSLAKEAGRGNDIEFHGGQLISRGASAAFFRFPYRLEDVTGTVHFEADGRVRLDTLTGRHGSARVTVNGTLTNARWDSGASLQIEGTDVALDEALLSCLSEKYRTIWSMFAPNGLANVQVRLDREPGTDGIARPWQTHITADLLGIAAQYDRLPLPMTGVRGRLRISPDGFRLEDLQGHYRDAEWSLDGTVTTPRDRPAAADLAIRAAHLPIDAELIDTLPEPAQSLLHSLTTHGRADLDGTVTTQADGKLDWDLHAALRLPSLRPTVIPLAFTDATATIRFSRQRVDIESLEGRHASGRVQLTGTLPLNNGGEALSLDVDAYDIPLSRELYHVLPPRAKQIWLTLRPAGRIDARARVGRDGHEPPQVELDIRPRHATLTPGSFPVPISDVTGRIQTTAAGVEITALTGRIGTGHVALDGTIDWNDDRIRGQLSLDAKHLTFTDELRHALPWRTQRAWRATQPRGALDVAVRHVAFEWQPDTPLDTSFDLTLGLHEVSLASVGTLGGIDGTIDIRGESDADGQLAIHGRLALDRLLYAGRLLTDLSGDFTRTPPATMLRLENLEADIYSGQASGFAELDLSVDHSTYGFSVVIRDMSLAEFLEAGRTPEAGPVTAQGVIRGTFFLDGELGDKEGRRGGGTVRVAEAQVMKVPLLLAILGVLNLGLPDENAFYEGATDFTLQGDELTLHPIDLRGHSLSLVGAGKMNTTTRQLDLTLLIGSPHRLPQLGFLTELAEGAARELMEVRVLGPLHQPRIEGQPLRSLQRTLEAIGELRPKKPRYPG